ncbi:hypothetical protein [Mesorhizobium sp. IMUNJ 23232]|uniref:hypothetical protein n=1 Tax=Mesorhizobium sp. IMUNJ 23232 TaxID=3376064 RepID=UPI00378822FF
MEKTIPTDKARQGRRGVKVLAVLVASLLLAFVVWAAVGIWGETIDGSTADNPGGVTAPAPKNTPTSG